MRFRSALVVAVGLSLVTTTYADGILPPRPYRYLHPSPSLARGNKHPSSGHRTLHVAHGASVESFTLFTVDGQAGLGAHPRTFSAGSGVTSMDVRIDPVNPPASLPKKYRIDGNAYRMSVVGLPGRKSVRVTQKVGVVLRWPLLPHVMLVYAAGHWREVCNSNSRDWQVNTIVVICHTSTLGTFVMGRRIY